MPFTVVFISAIKFMKLFNHFVIESVPHSIFCLTEPNRNETIPVANMCATNDGMLFFFVMFFFRHFPNIHFRYVRIFPAKICFISCMWVSIKNDLLSYHIISLFFNTCVSAIYFVVSLERKMCKHFRLRLECKHFGMICIFFPLVVCLCSERFVVEFVIIKLYFGALTREKRCWD